MADDDWSPAPVDWLAFTIDESKPVTEHKPATTTDESKPVTEHKPAATTNESKDKPNTTGVAPATEALPIIKFTRQNCVLILTDQEGDPAAIGSLRAAESRACTIQLGSLTQNRETSLALYACFPKLASGNTPGIEHFQRIGFYFYGNAFQSFESDFEITRVTELCDLYEILADRVSVLQAIIGKDLYKLKLTYKPQKVVTKAKDDPDKFSMPESSHAAGLFRYLVKCESLTTITLYFCATGEDIDALNDIRDRLKQEKDNKPFNEYRDKNGKIVIQWNSTFGTWCDVRSRLPSELNFRFPEQHAVTLAYGEIRDHAHTTVIARSRLTKPVKISFVVYPDSTQENEFPSKYFGFVDIVRLEAFLEVGLFKVGSKATLCFHQPLLTVEPEGWQCVVKPEIPNIEYPGTMVLIATRPTGSEQQVNVAKYPSPDMKAESEYSVWLYLQGSDTHSKRLVDCANKILYGEPGEGIKHLSKRQDLQKFCAGLELSSLPTPPAGLFLKSRLTSKQRKELYALEEARCSEEQRAALREIYSCRSWVNIIQGPSGAGKTAFAAKILIRIFKLFGLKTNCYASSDASTDVFVSKVAPELKPMRYHGLGMELAGAYRAAGQSQKHSKAPQNEDEPTFRQLTLRLFEDTIKQTDCIVAPCYLAGEKFFRNSTSPDIVIIDDAGSARELETLMVMYHNLKSAVMFIILGDPNQSPDVPPLRELDEDIPDRIPSNIFAPQLATSLMARQIANGIRYSTFTKD